MRLDLTPSTKYRSLIAMDWRSDDTFIIQASFSPSVDTVFVRSFLLTQYYQVHDVRRRVYVLTGLETTTAVPPAPCRINITR